MKADELLAGLTAVSCYFIIYSPYRLIENESFLTTKWLGAQGLFVALIIGIIVGEVFSRLSNAKRLLSHSDAFVRIPSAWRGFPMLSQT